MAKGVPNLTFKVLQTLEVIEMGKLHKSPCGLGHLHKDLLWFKNVSRDPYDFGFFFFFLLRHPLS